MNTKKTITIYMSHIIITKTVLLKQMMAGPPETDIHTVYVPYYLCKSGGPQCI